MPSGKCKLKQLGTTTHVWEWLKSKTLMIVNTNKSVEQKELSFIVGENAK